MEVVAFVVVSCYCCCCFGPVEPLVLLVLSRPGRKTERNKMARQKETRVVGVGKQEGEKTSRMRKINMKFPLLAFNSECPAATYIANNPACHSCCQENEKTFGLKGRAEYN